MWCILYLHVERLGVREVGGAETNPENVAMFLGSQELGPKPTSAVRPVSSGNMSGLCVLGAQDYSLVRQLALLLVCCLFGGLLQNEVCMVI